MPRLPPTVLCAVTAARRASTAQFDFDDAATPLPAPLLSHAASCFAPAATEGAVDALLDPISNGRRSLRDLDSGGSDTTQRPGGRGVGRRVTWGGDLKAFPYSTAMTRAPFSLTVAASASLDAIFCPPSSSSCGTDANGDSAIHPVKRPRVSADTGVLHLASITADVCAANAEGEVPSFSLDLWMMQPASRASNNNASLVPNPIRVTTTSAASVSPATTVQDSATARSATLVTLVAPLRRESASHGNSRVSAADAASTSDTAVAATSAAATTSAASVTPVTAAATVAAASPLTDNLWGLLGIGNASSRPVGPHLPPAIVHMFANAKLVSVHTSGSTAVLSALGLAKSRETRKAARGGRTLDGVAILSFPNQYVSGHGDGVELAPPWMRGLHRMPLDTAAIIEPSPCVADYARWWEPLLAGTATAAAAPRAGRAESSLDPLLPHETAAFAAIRRAVKSAARTRRPVGGVIVEAVLRNGSGGWRPRALRALAALCRELDILMVEDAVMTFARCGSSTLFLHDEGGYVPDVVAVGKLFNGCGLGGGVVVPTTSKLRTKDSASDVELGGVLTNVGDERQMEELLRNVAWYRAHVKQVREAGSAVRARLNAVLPGTTKGLGCLVHVSDALTVKGPRTRVEHGRLEMFLDMTVAEIAALKVEVVASK